MIYEFLDKKTGLGAKARDNEELAQELWKPGIKNSKERKFMSGLKWYLGSRLGKNEIIFF